MIGMHVVSAALNDVNYCITDPGKFVATEKVLWALVHNHPIVSSDWVHAILRRKSMADELPRCEDFIPQHGQTEVCPPTIVPLKFNRTTLRRMVQILVDSPSTASIWLFSWLHLLWNR